MAEELKDGEQNPDVKPKLCPHVAMEWMLAGSKQGTSGETCEHYWGNPEINKQYGPCNVRELKVGERKSWCTCGLSKTQPWCDSSHKGTAFRSLKFTVTKDQSLHQFCACKHTSTPPYCDGTHTNLPCLVKERHESCRTKEMHIANTKLCAGCGWVPDF